MNELRYQRHTFVAQWLILAVALLMLGFAAGYEVFQERGRVERREQERLLAASRVVQVNLEHNLASVNRVLENVSKEHAAEPASAKLNEHLKTLVEGMPSVRTVLIQDAAGRVRASSRPELIGVNFSQRDPFKVPRQASNADTLFVLPLVSTTLGDRSIILARMIPGANGEFAGVTTATLDPKYFDPLLESVRYAPDMVAGLNHGDGIVFLMAPPQRNDVVGRSLAQPGTFYTRHKESGQPVTVFSGAAQALGEERMVARRSIQPASLNMNRSIEVAVSRRLDKIYDSWRRDLALTTGLFTVAALAFTLGLYAYQRRYRLFFLREAEAAEALARSEWKLKTIIETEPEGVIVLAPDATLIQMNRAGMEMIEADAEAQVIGRGLSDVVAPEYRAAFGALNGCVNQGETRMLEFEIVGFKGGHRWLEIHAVPMRDGKNGIAGLLGVTRDITERKRAEAARDALEIQLRESQKMEAVGILAGGIAHDFNNILAAIAGNTSLAKQDIRTRPDEALVSLEEIDKATKRAKDIVQRILAFSRKSVQVFSVQPLRPLVEESINLMRAVIPAGVRITASFGEAPVYARCDATQIEQVLMNLCTNAWHAMKGDSGRIEIGVRELLLDQAAEQISPDLRPGRYVCLSVRDDGSGMEAATLAHIFEPFFTTKETGTGTGLGLSVVHGIVKSHKGAIKVDSAPGKGTRFEIFFPAMTPDAREHTSA